MPSEIKLVILNPKTLRAGLVQSCSTTFQLWKTLSDTYEKKVVVAKIYLIYRLYNFPIKESDSVRAHINKYESINSQLSAQGMTIEEEMRAHVLVYSLPPSWETFVIIMCNESGVVLQYFEAKESILTKPLGENRLYTIQQMTPI